MGQITKISSNRGNSYRSSSSTTTTRGLLVVVCLFPFAIFLHYVMVLNGGDDTASTASSLNKNSALRQLNAERGAAAAATADAGSISSSTGNLLGGLESYILSSPDVTTTKQQSRKETKKPKYPFYRESDYLQMHPSYNREADLKAINNGGVDVESQPSADNICPDSCGNTPMKFEPFMINPINGRVLEKATGLKTFYKISRPDLIDDVRHAVEEIRKDGGMEANSHCQVFQSCNLSTKEERLASLHSKDYQVCESYNMIHANNILVGETSIKLPKSLTGNGIGDQNILCKIAHYAADIASNIIFENAGFKSENGNHKHCIVQEQFINEQRNGGKTKRHVHSDDIYGGVFYLDTPSKGDTTTKLCMNNNEPSSHKSHWYTWSPELTENIFPHLQGKMKRDKIYPTYIEPQAGDMVFFPVGWVDHWVPTITGLDDNEKRTTLVFNMVCI